MFCVFLLVILARIFWVTDRFLSKKAPDGIDKITTSVKYFTLDGLIITYEIEKFLQCKQLVLNEHEHSFHWTGTNTPIITSDTMLFDKIVDGNNGFKKAVFKIKNPIPYNGAFMAHIRMQIDDSNKQSQPHISVSVNEPTQMINFTVQILYKRRNITDARLMRKRIDTPTLPYVLIKSIPFDAKTGCYQNSVYEPEVGYSYKIEWTR